MRRIVKTIFFTLTILLAALFLLNHHHHLYAYNPTSVAYAPQTLRIMTWNVHISDPAFPQKQPEIAAEIIRQGADVVLINEFDKKVSATMDSLVREAYPYVVDQYGWGCGDVLYSRYPITSHRRLQAQGLSPLVYEYRMTVKEQPVRMVGCHLVSSNNFSKNHRYTLKTKHDILDLPTYYGIYKKAKERRTQEAELIRECLAEEELPTIVLGDMNDLSGTSPLTTLEDAGLKDAWWERGTGFGFTFHEDWMHFRLDHILYDKHWFPISIEVGESELSDHKPLVAVFRRN